jgi:hypothetical protein
MPLINFSQYIAFIFLPALRVSMMFAIRKIAIRIIAIWRNIISYLIFLIALSKSLTINLS